MIGNILLTRYYTVWDATPLDEYGKPYLRIGFAQIKDDVTPPLVDMSNSKTVFIISAILCILVTAAVYLIYKKR